MNQIDFFTKENSNMAFHKGMAKFITYKATADIKDKSRMAQLTEMENFITTTISTSFKDNGKAQLRKAEPLSSNREQLFR